MKSSFSWPGRPPAEMISRNVNRFLTSILDGSPKRGAFYTSILDGTPKRGAFYTSILDGTPKRGAFCTSILDGTLKRGAFYTSILDGTPKRGAFCTSILDGALKRDAFFGRQGRGVSNTPPKRSRMGTRVAKGSQTRDSLSPAGPFDGAYAIRPYDGTSKEGASYTSYLVATPKRGAFWTSYLVGSLKRDAFCLFYSSFLALMQEKKQKKIKASGMPANFGDFLMALVYPANFPALGRGPFLALMQEKKQKKIKASAEAGEVGRVHDRWSRGCRPIWPSTLLKR